MCVLAPRFCLWLCLEQACAGLRARQPLGHGRKRCKALDLPPIQPNSKEGGWRGGRGNLKMATVHTVCIPMQAFTCTHIHACPAVLLVAMSRASVRWSSCSAIKKGPSQERSKRNLPPIQPKSEPQISSEPLLGDYMNFQDS